MLQQLMCCFGPGATASGNGCSRDQKVPVEVQEWLWATEAALYQLERLPMEVPRSQGPIWPVSTVLVKQDACLHCTWYSVSSIPKTFGALHGIFVQRRESRRTMLHPQRSLLHWKLAVTLLHVLLKQPFQEKTMSHSLTLQLLLLYLLTSSVSMMALLRLRPHNTSLQNSCLRLPQRSCGYLLPFR